MHKFQTTYFPMLATKSSLKTINICFATILWVSSSTKIRTISIIKTSFRTGISNVIFQSVNNLNSNTLIVHYVAHNEQIHMNSHISYVNTWTAISHCKFFQYILQESVRDQLHKNNERAPYPTCISIKFFKLPNRRFKI